MGCIYNIETLGNLITQLKHDNCVLSDSLKIRIDTVLRNISIGIEISSQTREHLFAILQNLEHCSHGEFKYLIRKIIEKIVREKRSVAEGFYISRNRSSLPANAIDYSKDVYTTVFPSGTKLFQWCKMIVGKKGATLYDSYTQKCTIGDYFSRDKVPLESLGAFRLYDLYDTNDEFLGAAQQDQCSFILPFEVNCLVSTAKGMVDNWNANYYFDGTSINRNLFSGLQTYGGNKQYFIPLTVEQKKRLAKIAQFE